MCSVHADQDSTSTAADGMRKTALETNIPTVFIVDDDADMREALCELLTCAELRVVACVSASDYLRMARPNGPACVILDVGLPDVSGIELQRKLGIEGHPPIIFYTANVDIPTSVRAIKAGAIDFLIKPCRKSDLRAAINAALEQDARVRRERVERERLRLRHSCLTPREREVLPLVVGGFLNKQAAAHLGISETTLQIHRSRVMRKMKADSLAHLVRMAGTLSVLVPQIGSR
jgi:FixJ family two-component response regulator